MPSTASSEAALEPESRLARSLYLFLDRVARLRLAGDHFLEMRRHGLRLIAQSLGRRMRIAMSGIPVEETRPVILEREMDFELVGAARSNLGNPYGRLRRNFDPLAEAEVELFASGPN